MDAGDLDFWRAHSPISDPGPAAAMLDVVPADPDALTAVSAQLVFHYRADGDWEANAISQDRSPEINLCYAADAFARLAELDTSLLAVRPPARRILGCCRDFSNLYVSMLRHHGIPARSRVGFAAYFAAGWWIDHVVVEVWDDADGGWRLIDPELGPEFEPDRGDADHADVRTQRDFNRLALTPDWFITAPQAWRAVRAGHLDPGTVVVMPDLEVPQTRGRFQIRHNMLHDTASLVKTNPLLWDDWGIGLDDEQVDPVQSALLDALAADTSDALCALSVIQKWAATDGIALPPTVRRIDPLEPSFTPRPVDVRRALGTAED